MVYDMVGSVDSGTQMSRLPIPVPPHTSHMLRRVSYSTSLNFHSSPEEQSNNTYTRDLPNMENTMIKCLTPRLIFYSSLMVLSLQL